MLSEREITALMRTELSASRFRHAVSVADLAEKMAQRHGANTCKARIAGLLHDCAKEMSHRRLVEYSRKHRVSVPEKRFITEKQPGLLHSYVSADVARRRYGVTDAGILEAIRHHTIGKPGMGILSKILFIVDLAAPDRRFEGAGGIRRLAFKDIDSALRASVKVKLLHVLKKEEPIHGHALKVWNEVCNTDE